MEITIETTEEKPLLKRTEITARMFFTGSTPSRLDVTDALAEKAKVDRDSLVIEKIDTKFGDTVAYIHANSYSDVETMKRLERANLLEKHAKPEPEPSEEPAENPAEKPAEAPEAEDAADDSDSGAEESTETDSSEKAPEKSED